MLQSSGDKVRVAFTLFMSGAATVGTNKARFVVPANGQLVGIHGDAGGAGSGAGNTVLNVKVNGTSVFTGATKLQIASGSSGKMTVGPFGRVSLREGDVISVDVDSIPATSGHSNIAVTISLGS